MPVRESLNKNTPVATLLVVVILAVALAVWVWRSGMLGSAATVSAEQWYYDTVSGKLFASPVGQVPPVLSPSNGEGVRAHVFTCKSGCGAEDLEGLTPAEVEERGLFVAYLERVTAEGKMIIDKVKVSGPGGTGDLMAIDEAIRDHQELRLLDAEDSPWVAADENIQSRIKALLAQRCPDRPYPPLCDPGKP